VKAASEFYQTGHRVLGWCKECFSANAGDVTRRRRLAALRHYSKGEPHCACCGETRLAFLTFDHLDNNGAAHRRAINHARLGTWLYCHHFPPGFQVLCHNCNIGRHLNGGVCPHVSA
jgi:hypothetical protein